MDLTLEQRAHITQFAEGLLSPKDVAQIMELPISAALDSMANETGDFYTAYIKGVLKLKYRLNTKNIQFAEQSSSHAMNKVLKSIDELKLIIQNEIG
jgi:hypothetical protein